MGDQLCQGDVTVIAKINSNFCPVIAMLELYMAKTKIPVDSNLFLFRPMIVGKIPKLPDSGQLSCSRLSKLLKEKLEKLGFCAAEISPHSLTAGGAKAVAEAGVSDRLFPRHGQWRSEKAKDGYVKDSLEKR